jgi:3-deoxy-D-manno-octulosonic-acid transferase
MLILDLLYALLLLCTFPLWVKYIFKKKYRRMFAGRRRPQIAPQVAKTVWIHAVSVGEVRSLKSLIHTLEEKKQPLVLSVTTPAGFEFACREFPSLTVIRSPFDLSPIIRRFIGTVNPKLVIFNELEIWPNWISLLHKKGIPILLVNGRMSESAFKRYRFFRFFLRRFIRHIDCFLVQNAIYRKRFQQLGIPGEKISLCGNIKADEADRSAQRLPAAAEVRRHLRLNPLSKKIITLASSHAGSERILVPAIASLSSEFFFIIVPRHVQRARAIARQLELHGLRYALHGSGQPVPDDAQVLIYDRMGYMLPIISITDIVFMGGTHDQKIGGHNFYEPAAMGKLILGGPHYSNFPDIGRELEEVGVYRQIASSRDLVDFAAHFRDLNLEQIRERARQAVRKRKGSLGCILEAIERYTG